VNYQDLEFRCLPNRDPEIIRWKVTADGMPYCYTVLWFRRDSEGYNIEFVGTRPFDIDQDLIWKMMRYGNDVLEARVRLEER